MEISATIRLATVMVFGIGTLWGFYWLPVREIAAAGLAGVWGSVAIVGAGVVTLAPLGWRGRHILRRADPWALVAMGLGGLAFVLYSVSFVYGQVAVVVILFFLTPVWSTLLGRIFLGWPITRLRIGVLVLGLAGLLVMLGGEGLWPVPRSFGEWLGLLAGFVWSVSSIGIRIRPPVPAAQGAFVFAAGAFVCGLVIAPLVSPLPTPAMISDPLPLLFWIFVTGGLWWAGFTWGLMWAVPKLDPARTGILLMSEVVVAAVSAAVIAGEHLGAAQLVGGALVMAAGLLEIAPQRRGRRISRLSAMRGVRRQ